MKEFFYLLPYITTGLTAIGFLMMLFSRYDRLSKSQIKRLNRLYSDPDISYKRNRASPLKIYTDWVTTNLVRIGYVNRMSLFYSLLRAVFIFFSLSSFGFFFLSGSSLNSSILAGFTGGFVSLFIPNLILIYLRSNRFNVLAQEYTAIVSYIYEALNGAQKDIYNAINDGLAVTTFLTVPLERFLNRYRSQGLGKACDALKDEIPIPETDQFINLISTGFEYKDRQNLMDYIQVLNESKHNLMISAKKRREKQREHFYTVLIILPAFLSIAITLVPALLNVFTLLESTTW